MPRRAIFARPQSCPAKPGSTPGKERAMSDAQYLPDGYRPQLHTREVETAIKDITDFFERKLAQALNIQRVTAPMFVRSGTGINDDLNGVELPVRFNVKNDAGSPVEIVQSLAKWKRMALARY